MKKDVAELIRRCESCQKYANIQYQSSSQLTSVIAPWPFVQWRIDILDLFPPTSSQKKFIVVAIGYFIKQVKAEFLASITKSKIEDFIQKLIIYRFSLPYIIITDNKQKFDNQNFKEFCAKFHIMHKLTSVDCSQSNGKMKVTNRIILYDLKTRLNETKGLWMEELYPIL